MADISDVRRRLLEKARLSVQKNAHYNMCWLGVYPVKRSLSRNYDVVIQELYNKETWKKIVRYE